MTFKYALTRDDYVAHQMHLTAVTPAKRRKQRRGYWLSTGVFVAVAVYGLLLDSLDLVVGGVVLTVITLLLYPKYQRWQYRKHYRQHYDSLSQGQVGPEGTLTIVRDRIHMSDTTGESTLNFTAVTQVDETADYFYVRLQQGSSIILPKSEVAEPAALREYLRAIGLSVVDYRT